MSVAFIAFAGFTLVLCTSLSFVVTTHIHGAYTLDFKSGIQKMHVVPTPRIGGAAIAIGYSAAIGMAGGELQRLLLHVGLAGLPALCFGLAEDLTKTVSVKTRLLATIASGLIFVALTGYSVTRVEVGGVDSLLAYPLIAFAFTGVAVGGVANAINLIDGFHGLASGTLIIMLLAFAVVGWRVGDTEFMAFGLVFAAMIAGFFVVNFPFGKLFLGDAGAYFSGYVVATMAVMLPARNPEVSPWISLLVLSYPVTETVTSILRRIRSESTHPGAPDDQHLHHIVHRNLAHRLAVATGNPGAQNAMTSLFIWALPLITLFALGVLSAFNAKSALIMIGVVILCYGLSYHGILASIRGAKKHTIPE